jgi:hypothetical protein
MKIALKIPRGRNSAQAELPDSAVAFIDPSRHAAVAARGIGGSGGRCRARGEKDFHYTTKASGRGAVREAIELILKSGIWEEMIDKSAGVVLSESVRLVKYFVASSLTTIFPEKTVALTGCSWIRLRHERVL